MKLCFSVVYACKRAGQHLWLSFPDVILSGKVRFLFTKSLNKHYYELTSFVFYILWCARTAFESHPAVIDRFLHGTCVWCTGLFLVLGTQRPTEWQFWLHQTQQLLAEHSFLISKDRMLILLCLAFRSAANPKHRNAQERFVSCKSITSGKLHLIRKEVERWCWSWVSLYKAT